MPEPYLENCNLIHLLLSIRKLFEVSFNRKNISFLLPEIDPLATQIMAEQKRLEQVIINIVKNAVESIEQNGEILVEIIKNNQQLILRIKYSGSEISKDAQRGLFTPFFTNKAEGQGIGWMLVREILDAHNFSFSLTNRELKGACFKITFV